MLGGQIIEKLAANQWHVEHLTLVAIHHVNHVCTTFKKSYSNLDMSGGITYTTPFLLSFSTCIVVRMNGSLFRVSNIFSDLQ